MGDNESVNTYTSIYNIMHGTMIRRAFSLFYLFIHFFYGRKWAGGNSSLLPVTSRRRDCSIAALACSRIDFLL